jgi:hypothetical protein
MALALTIARHQRVLRLIQNLVTTVLIGSVLTGCMAPVAIDTVSVPPGYPETPVVSDNLPTIDYTIQVGAFSTAERAAAYASGLIRRGLDAYYFIDGDGLFKVRFERFDLREAAWQRAATLQALAHIDDFFIVQPHPDLVAIDPRETLRINIVDTARRFIGTPYRWGGESIQGGFDCSGLTMTVYRLNGLELPRNSRAQFQAGQPIHRNTLQAGDLVFFATGVRTRVSHVGVYSGEGHFIHAPGQGKRIQIASLSNGYFSQRYLGARRYF